jgi:D-hydroxyproline dehydrogenase subunit beta
MTLLTKHSLSNHQYDVAVIGAGIVGLATAWTAAQRGLRVAVIERQAQAVGASIRNFGFITVTGQRRGAHWNRALKTAEIWKRIAPLAGIQVVHQGLYVLAQRTEAMDVLQAFMKTEMGEHCRLLSKESAAQELAVLQPGLGVLFSPHECRVESRDAIPLLTSWLQRDLGVDFFWNTPVLGVSLPQVFTSRGEIQADHCIVCPGNDLNSLYPDVLDQAGIKQCTLQMMRVQASPGIQLPGAVMSDLSLVRYEGYADLPEALSLKAILQNEQKQHLDYGVHLIVVQSADGSWVVGDSHVYGQAESPFSRSDIEALIVSEMHQVLRFQKAQITERWIGTYASASDVVFKASPSKRVALGVVTGGTGASTSFAFAEELLDLALHSQ